MVSLSSHLWSAVPSPAQPRLALLRQHELCHWQWLHLRIGWTRLPGLRDGWDRMRSDGNASCWLLPSGKLTKSYWKLPIYRWITHKTWWFSIVMLVYRRVVVSLPICSWETSMFQMTSGFIECDSICLAGFSWKDWVLCEGMVRRILLLVATFITRSADVSGITDPLSSAENDPNPRSETSRRPLKVKWLILPAINPW